MNTTELSSATAKQPTANVTLEIYSGRPDPTWSLDDVAFRGLGERLAALKMPAPDTPGFDGLGYRGLRILITGEEALATVTVSRGVVTVERGAERSRFVDTGRELEMWLVKGGEKTLTPTLFKQVIANISAASR